MTTNEKMEASPGDSLKYLKRGKTVVLRRFCLLLIFCAEVNREWNERKVTGRNRLTVSKQIYYPISFFSMSNSKVEFTVETRS